VTVFMTLRSVLELLLRMLVAREVFRFSMLLADNMHVRGLAVHLFGPLVVLVMRSVVKTLRHNSDGLHLARFAVRFL